MNDRPLDQSELELLEMIRKIHAEKGPFLRSTLSVIGRGQGLEVTRSFNRLKSLGLVEEVERRPFFLLRLFGVKSTILLRPRPESFSAPAPLTSEARQPAEPIAVPPVEVVAEVVVEGVAPAAITPIVVAPEAVTAEPAQPEPIAPKFVPDEPAPEEPAPVEPAPVEPKAVKPAPAKSKAAKPARLPLDAYTDDIGGQPLAYTPMPFAAGLDPDLLDGMRETLALLGMELTVAGEVLISDRMGKAMSAGEALGQVAVYAFAHAAHHDLLDGGQMDGEILHDFAVAVIGELSKLHGAGEISDAAFDRDQQAIVVLSDKGADRGPVVADLLADPVGGAAPPALLPEELRGVGVYDD